MNMIQRFFVYLMLSLTLTQGVFAADMVRLRQLFVSSFWTQMYEQNRCGENIQRLISKAMDLGVNLNNAYILGLTDSQGDFGMINAFQAREGGPFIQPRRTQEPTNLPGRMNWFHHVVLYADGKILDFDFTNEAIVVGVPEYFNAMFVEADKQKDVVWKKHRMRGFRVAAYPAEDYMLRIRSRMTTSEIEKVYTLEQFAPQMFR